MKSTFKLNVPDFKFSFTPVKTKSKAKVSKRHISKILFCESIKGGNGNWVAKIDTSGLEGYSKTTILPFTEESYILKGKPIVFRHKKDAQGHYVMIMRSIADSEISPGNPQDFTPFCEKCMYSGRIITIEGIKYFDVRRYVSSVKEFDKKVYEALYKNDNYEENVINYE